MPESWYYDPLAGGGGSGQPTIDESNAFTTRANIETRVSALGVELRDDHDTANAVPLAIEWASSQIEFYCARYPRPSLLANRWIRSVATDLAVYYLATHRLNPSPKSAEMLYEEAIRKLELIQQGKAVVPNAPTGRDSLPTVTHQLMQLGRYPTIVTERPRSTGTAEGYRRPVDNAADIVDQR